MLSRRADPRGSPPIPLDPGASRIKSMFARPTENARSRGARDPGEKYQVSQHARLTPAGGDFYAAGLSMPPPAGRAVARANP